MNTTWSRREFLELSGAAVGASLAPTSLRAGRMPPSDSVRFGMIGVGMQGSGLLGAAIALPGVTCAGAADLYDGRHMLAKEIAGPNLPATREYRRLLDDKNIDCVIAAVPDHWHRRMVVEAVSAGKDIYIEKPMSHTAAEGVAMVDAVRKSGRILQVGSQRVSSPICAKVKEMIAQGMLGDRSEEHTSELQLPSVISYAVFCLKKKKKTIKSKYIQLSRNKKNIKKRVN